MKVGFLLLLAMVTASAQTPLQHLHDVQAKYLALESAPGSPADLPAARIEYWRAVTAALQAADKVAQYGHDGGFALPDPSVTPGAVDKTLIADTTGKSHKIGGIEHNLCAKDFRTGPFRNTSEATKKKACAEYGIAKCPDDATLEIDHLISLEIGGQDTLANLWPQPQPQARTKDHELEDVLPKLICSGKIGLADAQRCISGDWVKCAARVKGMR